jgi:hypothetical protein
MAQNDDFSFVRFLKVVKTLYESSTFTQLGKTVGSALSHKPLANAPEDEEDTCEFTETSHGEEDNSRLENAQPQESSLMTLLGACTSPREDTVEKETKEKSSKKKKKKNHDRDRDRGDGTVDTDSKAPASLLDSLMNCTLGHEGENSDDDTHKSFGSYDDQTLEDSTFDSITDDDSSKRGRGRSRRRRR